MSPSRRILFVGGGTAGHTSKLLAVMEAVQAEAKEAGLTIHCTYIGLKDDLVSPTITQSSLDFEKYSIASGKFNRFLTWKHITEFGKLIKGRVQARGLLQKIKPDIIFAGGGTVTVPIAAAARRRRIPLITHETDVIPGLANRLTARAASYICTTYPIEYYTTLPQEKLRQVGQPVRQEFYQAHSEPLIIEGRTVDQTIPLISVIGGSQGGRRINQLVAGGWEELLAEAQLVHITGPNEHATYAQQWSQLNPALQNRLWVVPFVTNELAALFQKSSIVISRAGGTIAELAAVHAATILIPLSTAAQNHQWGNAKVLTDAGAAIALDETRIDSTVLIGTVLELLESSERRAALSQAITAFDHPQAAQAIAKLLLFP